MSTNLTFIHRLLAASAGALLLAGCIQPAPLPGPIPHEPFGLTPEGQAVDLYTLRNRHGVEARIITYGGIIVSLKVPDRKGQFGDVVLGYDNLDAYVKN